MEIVLGGGAGEGDLLYPQGEQREVLTEDLPGLSEAFTGEAKDGGLVDEPVDGGDGLGFGGEERVPVFEACVGSEEEGALTMAGGDEPEEMLCGVGVKGVVAKFVEVEDVVFFVTLEGSVVGTVDEGGVELFEEVGGEDFTDGVSSVAGGPCDGVEDAGFAEAGSTDADDVPSVFFYKAAVFKLPDEGCLELWSDREVIGVEALDDGGQTGAFKVSCEAAVFSGVDFELQHAEGEVAVGGRGGFGLGQELWDLVPNGGEAEAVCELGELYRGIRFGVGF